MGMLPSDINAKFSMTRCTVDSRDVLTSIPFDVGDGAVDAKDPRVRFLVIKGDLDTDDNDDDDHHKYDGDADT